MFEWVLVMTLVTTTGYSEKHIYPTTYETASDCREELRNQFFDPQSEFNKMMEPLWEQKKLRTSGMHCEKRNILIRR